MQSSPFPGRWLVRFGRRCLVALLGAAFLCNPVVRAQQLDVQQELEEAKALYREAKFAQAIAKLQLVVARLEQAGDRGARGGQADAHLHLALSYIALNDPAAARESLKAMLRLDPERRLDPQVYAPKVVALFEEAKAEVAKEPPVVAAAAPTPAASVSPAAKKGRSKVPLIVLGGGVAAAGVAIAASAGGSPAVTNDIALVSVEPPAGSAISLSTEPRVLVNLRVTLAGHERGLVFAELRGECLVAAENSPPFEPGSGLVVRLLLDLRTSLRPGGCEELRPPVRLDSLRTVLIHEKDAEFRDQRALVTKVFRVGYTIVQ